MGKKYIYYCMQDMKKSLDLNIFPSLVNVNINNFPSLVNVNINLYRRILWNWLVFWSFEFSLLGVLESAWFFLTLRGLWNTWSISHLECLHMIWAKWCLGTSVPGAPPAEISFYNRKALWNSLWEPSTWSDPHRRRRNI